MVIRTALEIFDMKEPQYILPGVESFGILFYAMKLKTVF